MFENFLANYRNVAGRLGLTFEFKGANSQVRGAIDGFPVLLYFGAESVCTASVWRAPPEVRINVSSKGLLAKLAELVGSGHGPIDDPAFDKVFAVSARDTSLVQRVLAPEVRAALLELAEEGLHPSIHDGEVRLWRFVGKAAWDSEEVIERDILSATKLARRLCEAFEHPASRRA